MTDSNPVVEIRPYGVHIWDRETYEGVSVDHDDVPGLVQTLINYLET